MTQNLFPALRLLSWAEEYGRRPPWRESVEPFGLALAEVLLQKTKATDAVKVWQQLFARYETPATLSQASDCEIQRIVEPLGLGRQRTARLKALARSWKSLWGSGSSLAGLGPYGNAIVRLTVGLDITVAPIDGNIARIMTRFYGFNFAQGEARKKPEVRQVVRGIIADRRRPEDKLNVIYALVDLGSIVCRTSKPSCSKCPLAANCSFASSVGLPIDRHSFTARATARARGGGTASEIC